MTDAEVITMTPEEAKAILEQENARSQEKVLEEKNRLREEQRKIWHQQLDNCVVFFNRVAALVDDIYEVVPGKSKQWKSYCLVPKGMSGKVNYYGKPANSLRVAMNWNWRANLEKCSVAKHIQCVTPDLPFVKPRPRDNPDRSSPPIYGNMVAIFDEDHKYHCLYGEKYDRKTKTWEWKDDLKPEDVAKILRERLKNALQKDAEETETENE